MGVLFEMKDLDLSILQEFLIHKGIIDEQEFFEFKQYKEVNVNPFDISSVENPSEELQVLAVTKIPQAIS